MYEYYRIVADNCHLMLSVWLSSLQILTTNYEDIVDCQVLKARQLDNKTTMDKTL